MNKRYVSIWFPHLLPDWFVIRQPHLKTVPFVLSAPSHGRMIVVSANSIAQAKGVYAGMVLADARAMISSLEVLDDKPELADKLIKKIAEWCIRYTPFVAVDFPQGLILDATGCTHLWNGDDNYLNDIINRLNKHGYTVRGAMADTIGAAWAIARYGNQPTVIKKEKHIEALLNLPPEALRIEIDTIERLHKLGLSQIHYFLSIPAYSLRRRFGQQFTQRLNQALGLEEEILQPIYPVVIYQERLPCIEPIATRTGIEIALQQLLDVLCHRLQREGKGLRIACFLGYRIDGKIEKFNIETSSPSSNAHHLFKLFQIKLENIRPEEGIELFQLDAGKVEDHVSSQEDIWKERSSLKDLQLSQLLDRLAMKIGADNIHRYLPAEHYLPERSFKKASSLQEKVNTHWRSDKPRPIQLLSPPEQITVTALIPDYPPMLFRYKGKVHKIIRADGPERIEQEWWIKEGRHRDYYYVEDEEGKRYWLFRSGHYTEEKKERWFIHGFFP